MRPFITVTLLFIAGAVPAAEILIQSKKAEAVSMNPEDALWRGAPVSLIPLVPQKFVLPQGGGATKFVEVKSLYTNREVYFYMSWEDKTQSAKSAPSGKFTDACAIEFPLKEGSMPSPFMGEKGGPVNIWMWRAAATERERSPKAYVDFYRPGAIETHVKFPDRPVQSLFAEGSGTLMMNPVQDVEGAASFGNGRWRVVFRRSLGSKNGTRLKEGSSLPIAFAVWNGASAERDGAKSLSLWHTLILGEGKAPAPASEIENGQRVFLRYGCAACHGPNGKGGVKNQNAQGGLVPPIHRVKEGFTEEEIKAVIWEGRASVSEDAGPSPPLHMIAWKSVMDENELNNLVKYLFSLMPRTEGEEW